MSEPEVAGMRAGGHDEMHHRAFRGIDVEEAAMVNIVNLDQLGPLVVDVICTSTSILVAFDETKLQSLAAVTRDATSSDSPHAEHAAVGTMHTYLATQFPLDHYVYGSERWACHAEEAPLVAQVLTAPELTHAYRAFSEETGQEQVHKLPTRTHSKSSVADVDVLWFKIDTPANLAVSDLYTLLDTTFDHNSLSTTLETRGAGGVDSVADRSALTDLYLAMGGALWKKKDNWIAPNVSMCLWHGVKCTPCSSTGMNGASVECRVAELNLDQNNLQGPIAPAVQLLTNLTKLVFSRNAVVGSIPSFSALQRLSWLDLNSAQLSGGIPDFEALTQLQFLNLKYNFLSGTVPAFAAAVRLKKLYLQNNRLVGTVPELTTLAQLQFLFLNSNALTGTVPSFSANAQLLQLNLYNNQLTGTLPSFEALPKLQRLFLGFNRLTGTVPAFSSLLQLTQLGLQMNSLSGTVPDFAALTLLEELKIFQNSLTGTVPAFEHLVRLQRLDLSNNGLTGTVPAFAALSQLHALILHSNSLSGTISNFECGPKLVDVDLSTNLFSGALPPLVADSPLMIFRVARNCLTGSVPVSWRTLRALTLIDFAENHLDGEILLFQPSELPPLSAGFVNFSFNRFGGTFNELPPPDTINLTSIDIRGNPLLCPFPQFSLSLRALRSDCLNDWVRLGKYVGIGVAFAAVNLALILFLRRRVPKDRLWTCVFAIFWIVSATSLVSDVFSYRDIIRFLQIKAENCSSFNEARVFFPQIYDGDELPASLQVVPSNYLFSDWIDRNVWIDAFGNGLERARSYATIFSTKCQQAPECAHDSALFRCYEGHPNLADGGGGTHSPFLRTIWTFIAIRAAYELFCLIVILTSYARGSLVLSCRVWIRNSAFLPVLMAHSHIRGELRAHIVLADTTPSEYIWELLTTGVFVTGLKVYSQTYYLLRVSQIGLSWPNWISLFLGLVTVVRLVTQALWSWRIALLKEYYGLSGADYDYDDVDTRSSGSGTGSVDLTLMTDYVRMS